MKVGFAGTPEFARAALEAIVEAGHEVVIVMTQPDRPAGRGMKLAESPVKQYANRLAIPVLQPSGLRLDGKFAEQAQAARDALVALDLDVLVVAAYGLILPTWVLEMPRYGCLNIHASLLPRWRGAAPIQRAIEAGDAQTGVTIMQMDAGLDTGDMLLVEALDILPTDNGQTLHDKLTTVGASLIVEALQKLPLGQLQRVVQPAQGVTYAEKLQKTESLLDVTQSAELLARRIRAFNPVPGAKVVLPGLNEPVKVFVAQALPGALGGAAVGAVVSATSAGIDLMTGEGVLRITELQRAGGKRQTAAQFLTGWNPT